jgi:monoterpene epsilon-lactone hydrolase
MTAADARPVFHLPARDIPVPSSISEQAQAMLAMGPLMPDAEYPPLDDPDAWRAMIAERESAVLAMLTAARPGAPGPAPATQVDEINVGGFPVYVVLPAGVSPDDRRVYLDIHGGAWIQGGGEVCRATALRTAPMYGARVWAVDYRMPPGHPYPTPLDDCVAAYRALLEERHPGEIIIGGTSAGGNLAAALILRARGEGLPLPAAVLLNTPATDLTMAGDTWQTNLGLDTVLTGDSQAAMLLYAAGGDLRDPYISPLFGDLKGFPPTMLTSGTRDRLLSDTVRMHRALRAAGVPAELHVLEAAGHGRFLGMAPEDRAMVEETRRFLGEHWAVRAGRSA